MIKSYLNTNAEEFLSRINTDENREWFWRFLSIIKKRFPKADHWTTGGVNKSYIDLRIGKKSQDKSSGWPVFYFRINSSKEPEFVLHNTLREKLKTYQAISPNDYKTDAEIEAWFDQHQSLIETEKNSDLQGHGLNPIAYIKENNGAEPDTTAPLLYNPKNSPHLSPLNQILFGPPGTGKTYATIDETLKILDSDFFEAYETDRSSLKARFDSLAATNDVRFVTFHQSFSYEDFVEGLRAVTNDDKQLEYLVEPGVFKRLCDDARTIGIQPAAGIRSNPRIWKVSINGTGSSTTKTYCLDHGEARIGWGETGDLMEMSDQNLYYLSLGSGNQGTLRYFKEEIVPGDILLCIHSAEEIGAIGVVTGDYRFDKTVPKGVIADYNHVRPVNWLYRDLKLPILPLNNGKQFTLKTVYSMERFTWGDLLAHIEKSGAVPTSPSLLSDKRTPRVLIVDEINRGNISRIFGELITLIEPTKREGETEALSVILPYSKKPFSVPSNVYVIGTMNTADRSLAGLDIALRRRFTFKEMPPRPELLEGINIGPVNMGQLLRTMNERIEVLLDRDHCLGHSYFMSLKDEQSLTNLAFIFRQQILPLLQEYFFEDWERIAWVLNNQPFVQRVPDNLTSLFSADAASNLQNSDRRWRINEAAFTNIESYRGILGASA